MMVVKTLLKIMLLKFNVGNITVVHKIASNGKRMMYIGCEKRLFC